MAYTFKTNIANKSNYGSKRDLSSIKYIVIHYTANDGDTDENNGNYFKNNVVKVSAHYFVDDDSVTQSVYDNYVAYSVGGSKYSDCATTGGGKLHGIATNSNTLNIEICDDIKNGTVYPSAKTIENAVELTKKKMKEYNIPKERVIRHFQITGKRCPSYWCGTPEREAKWKSEFWNKLSSSTSTSTPTTTTKELYRVRKSWQDASSQIGAYASLDNAKKACKDGYFVFDSNGKVVYPVTSTTSVKKPDVIYQVYADGKWWGEIKNYNEVNSNGYAGVLGKEISGIRVKLSNGKKTTIKSHITNYSKINWLSEVTKWDNTSNGYSGIKGKAIDCVAMKAEGYTLKYRVHVKGGKWLNWVSKYDTNDSVNGLAGIYGKPIDAIQITVV